MVYGINEDKKTSYHKYENGIIGLLNHLEIKEINFGKSKLEVIKTPGHTPGSVCLYSKEDNLLFSGDTLFKDLRGRTDFKYGSTKKIFESLRKLMELPEDTDVFSGHGESTTIGREKPKYTLKN